MSTPISSQDNFLALHAQGSDRIGILNAISSACTQAGCQILDSRWIVLGSNYAFAALLRGSWSAVAKLEASAPKIGKKIDSEITLVRTQPRSSESATLPYAVSIITIQRAEVMQDITAFFTKHDIAIEDLSSETYLAPRHGTPMLSISMTVSLPCALIASLREEFLVYCEERQLDAALEPYKS